MQVRAVAKRVVGLALGALMLAAACSSSNASPKASDTTASASATSTTADPNLTPNSIPFVPRERIGLPGDWVVTVSDIRYPKAVSGLKSIADDERYVEVDLAMEYQGTTAQTVEADKVFTLTDSLQKTHLPMDSGKPNGIDGSYVRGTSRTGTLIFTGPKDAQLGLVLYGPRIGSKVSFFAIDPPTVPDPE